MRLALVGLGATGSIIGKGFRSSEVSEVRIFDPDVKATRKLKVAMDTNIAVMVGPPEPYYNPDVTILAQPAGNHLAVATAMLEGGSHIVSLSDDPREITKLLKLDEMARSVGRSVVVGAGFVPGMSCLLARWAGERLDEVHSINVAKAGTAGPACARQHHRALKNTGRDWIDGGWEVRRGGSGRDLAWFPEPIGARDCYRGSLASPLLLQRQFPATSRISARVAATRRDRLTNRLPMLRPPHEDGGPGGLRVEVRGLNGGQVETIVLGVMAYPSFAAATVAAMTARVVGRGEAPVGVSGLAEWSDPGTYLAHLVAAGLKPAVFTGS